MYGFAVAARNKVLGFLYRTIAKPIFFRFDPEDVHDLAVAAGRFLGSNFLGRGLTRFLLGYHDSRLRQEILGITFENPVGLAAGFDKDGHLPGILPAVGFGFAEVGSVTGEPCAGNPRPRLWRLIRSRSLLVYYGLKNDGCAAIAKRLAGKRCRIPLGISIAKTNCKAAAETDAGIRDYVKAYETCKTVGLFDIINISCPNAYGGEPFTDPGRLERLLIAIDQVRNDRPMFVKLSPDLSRAEIDVLLEVISRHRVEGIVCSNLTKVRGNPHLRENNIPEKGGMSGKVVEDLANDQIAYIYGKTKGKYVVVGCGGIFTAEDAYRKIRLGASLVELITGMIFEGPQAVSEINLGLAKLLKRDGFSSVGEAVGKGI